MPHDVFISHSGGDKVTADATVAALEAHGIRCWVAPRDVVPGVQWANAIVQAITECQLMVLVFSSDANDSDHIVREVELAAHHRKPIVPLRVENVMPSPTLDYYIAGTHWLDAMDPPLEAHLERLSAVVRELLDHHLRSKPAATGATAGSTNRFPFRDEGPGPLAVLAPPAPTPAPSPRFEQPPTSNGTELLPAPPPRAAFATPASMPPPATGGPRRGRVIALVLALALIVAGGAAAAVLLTRDDGAADPVASPSAVASDPTGATGATGGSQASTARAPQHLRTGSVRSDEVVLRWNPAPAGAAIDHFLVIRDGEVIGQPRGSMYIDTTVEPARTYVYRVVAVGPDGSRAPSQALRVRTDALPVTTTPGPGSDSGGSSGGAPPPPPVEPTCSAIDHFEGKC